MISSATKAKATSSARRMTGGNSALLSGTGVPCGVLESRRSLGRTRTMVLPRAKAAVKGGNDTTAAMARTELRRHNVGRPPRFHRGIVSGSVVDMVAIGSCRTELRGPGHVVGPEHPGGCASNGAAHDTVSRRQSPIIVARDQRACPPQRRDAGVGRFPGCGQRANA